jgi:hypothetical protein
VDKDELHYHFLEWLINTTNRRLANMVWLCCYPVNHLPGKIMERFKKAFYACEEAEQWDEQALEIVRQLGAKFKFGESDLREACDRLANQYANSAIPLNAEDIEKMFSSTFVCIFTNAREVHEKHNV